MTTQRRIEAALRSRPPDEPDYRGSIAARIGAVDAGDADDTDIRPLPELVPAHEPGSRSTGASTRRWMRVGTVAAAVAGVAGIAWLAANRDQSVAPPTTDAPTTAPSPSTFEGRWVGTSTDGAGAAPVFLVVTDGFMAIEREVGGIVTDFRSEITSVADGMLDVSTTDASGTCAAGSEGSLAWTRSPGGAVLTLGVLTDACAPRGEAFSGTWELVACPTRGSDCLGPLEAGRHRSVSFDPLGTRAHGQLTYDTPVDGWSSPLDDRARLVVAPPGTDERSGVAFYADVAAPAGACATSPAGATGAAPIAGLVSDAAQGAGASATTTPTTVGGFDARVVDLTFGSGAPCGGSAPVLVARDGSPVDWSVTAGPSARVRVVLVDLPGGRTMALVVSTNGTTEDHTALLDTTSALIDSLTIEVTP